MNVEAARSPQSGTYFPLLTELGNWQKVFEKRMGRGCQFLEETADSALELFLKTFRGLPKV